MSANIQPFEFIVEGVESNLISVMKFSTLNHQLCGHYQVDIDLMVPKGFNMDVFEGKKAYLKLWEDEKASFIHGWITQYSSGQSIGLDSLQVSLQLSSPIAFLEYTRQSRVFKDQSVIEMITRILTENHWKPGSFEFQIKENLRKEEWIIQDQESDLAFILHELSRAGLVFTFRQTEEEAILIFFVAKIPDTALFFGHKTVSCIAPKGMGKDPVILKMNKKATLGPDGISVAVIAQTTMKGLMPGQQLSIQEDNEGQFHLKGDYRIVGIEQQGDARPGFSTWGKQENPIDYINTLHLVPLEMAYKLPFHPKRTMTGIQSATVETTGGDHPYLDDEGHYRVRFPFDESNSPPGDASITLPLIQPLAGAYFGCHFPVRGKTEVGISFRLGDGCHPIIMGILPNPETSSPIKMDEPTRHRYRSWGDNTLLMEDLKNHESIKLFTYQEHNRLFLDATKNKEQVSLASRFGAVIFYAGKSGLIKVRNNFSQKVGKNALANIGRHRECVVEFGNLELHSKRQLVIKSLEETRFKTLQNSVFQVGNSFNIHAKNNISLHLRKTTFTIKNPSKTIYLKANKSITVQANQEGNISLRQADSFINITKKGFVHFKAKEILLKAKKIIIPSLGEGSI